MVEFEDILKVVNVLLEIPESTPFREPVAWKALGLTDYPRIVSRPMDLGTIKRKLEQEPCGYVSPEEAVADIRLVWRNCMLYNQDGSEFYHLADAFAQRFEEAYARLRGFSNDEAAAEASTTAEAGDDKKNSVKNKRLPSLAERIAFSHDIFKLKSVEMAGLLTLIEDISPSAVKRRRAADEVLINVDAMDPECFHEASAYVVRHVPVGSLTGKSKGPAETTGTSSASRGSTSTRASGEKRRR